MRATLATLLLACALLSATAAAQVPVAPVVETGPAQAVGQVTATLTGAVDPNGSATDYRFEYGTTTAYGSATPDVPAGDGDDEVAVRVPVEGLTPATTYHYRLVAGAVAGADRTFKTAVAPTPPRIFGLAAADKTATSARLTARVNPGRSATTVAFEWGTTPAFGNRTPEQTLPAGRRRVALSAAPDGLPAYRRIHWRVVATNAVGIARSGTATFTTLRALDGATLRVTPAITAWGVPLSISGRVGGAGVGGVSVALEQTSFPFDAGFQEVATARTSSGGDFRFPSRTVLLATRFRAVTRGAQVVASPIADAQVRTRVGIRATRRTRRALRLVGDVNPGLPAGRATLQRRTRSGVWIPVAVAALRAHDALRSSYRFAVRRLRRAAAYRVYVEALDAGAHLNTASRSVLVAKKPKRKRPAARPRRPG